MLELDHVSFAYPGGKSLLRDLSFTLEKGDFTLLLGGNGAGKSTILALAAGRFRPQSGRILLDGTAVSAVPPRLRSQKIATVFQQTDSAAAPDFTVYEMAMLGRDAFLPRFGAPSEADREAVKTALLRMELTALKDRAWHSLSGGERQRAALASALARKPDYLLLDEPTSAADPARRVEAMRLLSGLPERPGILIVTHDLALAKAFGKKILLLRDGALYKAGAPETVLTRENVCAVYGPDAAFFL